MANYNDPRLQRLLLKGAASQPYGGVANRVPGLQQYLSDQERRKLALTETGLQSKMNTAKIGQMAFERGMAEKRLGLSGSYLDIAKQDLGLAERGFGIRSQLAELDKSRFGLAEKYFNLDTQKFNLGSQEADWRNKQFSKKLKSEENSLDLQTYLGLGTAAWSAYEGARRAKETRADTEAQRAWQDAMLRQGLLNKMGIGVAN